MDTILSNHDNQFMSLVLLGPAVARGRCLRQHSIAIIAHRSHVAIDCCFWQRSIVIMSLHIVRCTFVYLLQWSVPTGYFNNSWTEHQYTNITYNWKTLPMSRPKGGDSGYIHIPSPLVKGTKTPRSITAQIFCFDHLSARHCLRPGMP